MLSFSVIPAAKPALVAGEFTMPVFANRSIFPGGIAVLADVDLVMPAPIASSSSFGGLSVAEGPADVELLMPIFTNVSTFPDLEIDEAPSDGTLLMPIFTNVSTFPDLEIDEAPADGIIRMAIFTNVSTFEVLVIQEDEREEDDINGAIAASGIGISPIDAADV